MKTGRKEYIEVSRDSQVKLGLFHPTFSPQDTLPAQTAAPNAWNKEPTIQHKKTQSGRL